MTRTTEERARLACPSTHWDDGTGCVKKETHKSIDTELRTLVEEIAALCADWTEGTALPDEIRRRFLGPPSAEEVAIKACQSYGQKHGCSEIWTECVKEIVSALRQAGLLREEAL